jgi:restriction system protein
LRRLEEIIAELLKVEGYDVELRKGTKNGGIDVIAQKHLPTIGYVGTIWQSKHFKICKKMGIGIIPGTC